MTPAIKALVRRRSGDACEYCGLSQDDAPFAAFHIEHVIPRRHGGSDDPENLALACHHCNEHKGTNLAGIDPEDGAIVPLFNPRRDRWSDHFEPIGPILLGRTPAGRATIRVLGMNASDRVELRRALLGGIDIP